MTTFYIKDQNGSQSSFNTTDLIAKHPNNEIYSIKSLSNSGINSLYFKKFSSVAEIQTLESKIEFMVNHQPQTELNDGSRICWPLYCVYDANDSFTGYLMYPALEGSIPLEKVLKGEYPTNSEWHTFEDYSQASCDLRLNTSIAISQVLRSIGDMRRYTFNNLTPMSFMVTSDGKMSLIDCDSIIDRNDQLNQSIGFNHVDTSGYIPPEQLGKNISAYAKKEPQERFSLAVIIYELMFRVHPYNATFKSPYTNLGSLDDKVENSLFVHGRGSKHINYMLPEHEGFGHISHKLKSLFHLAFDIESKDRRPTPQLWEDTLTLLVTEGIHGLKSVESTKGSCQKPKVNHHNTNPLPTTPPPIAPTTENYNNASLTNYSTSVDSNWWHRWGSKLFIAVAILFISAVALRSVTSSFKENSISSIDDAQSELLQAQRELEIAASEGEQQNSDSSQNILNTSTANDASFELTNQYLYVISDKANLRQRPSLNAPVVLQVDYNTKLNKTNAPTIEEGGISWVNVSSSGGTRGWMSELILSKYPREILHSKCGIRNNEVEYIVNSAGVNVRSQPNLNDNSVIGVIQKGEIVCPYMYVNTSNRTVGRWMGFQLTNGNTAWVAESLLERYYYEPEPVREYLDDHEPDSSSDTEGYFDEEYYDDSWF